MTSNRSYSGMKNLNTFLERYTYLKLDGVVSAETFGSLRGINQSFYISTEWKRARRDAIVRDNGCDLGIEGFEIHGDLLVHHINPLTIFDFEEDSEKLTSLDNLITTTHETHNAIHYGKDFPPMQFVVERFPNDTKLW